MISLWCIRDVQAAFDKFKHWFPTSPFLDSIQDCIPELEDYWTDNRTQCWTTCTCAMNCLLTGASEATKANSASASVMLGLTPSILSLLGPTTEDLAILSTSKPLLSLLLSLGSPTVGLHDLFAQANWQQKLRQPVSNIASAYHSWLNEEGWSMQALITTIYYLIAFAAISNSIENSIRLDLRTVSSWRCGQMYMPLMWSSLPLTLHICGIIAIHTRAASSHRDVSGETNPGIYTRCNSLFHQWFNPFQLSSTKWESLLEERKDQRLTEFFFWAASVLAIIHMAFGVLAISSLQFIQLGDAMPVFVRYAVSAAICQAILLGEVSGIRKKLQEVTRSTNAHESTSGEAIRNIETIPLTPNVRKGARP